jgi:hypothetical protein
LPYGFSSIKLLAVTATGAKFGPVGYEVILLYIACLASLVIGGSGPFAIDGLVRKRFERGQVPARSRQLRDDECMALKLSTLNVRIAWQGLLQECPVSAGRWTLRAEPGKRTASQASP